jgi:transposase
MLSLNTNKIYLHSKPVNMHKSFEGLSAVVQQSFPGELYSGAYFVFLNKSSKCMKVLAWDGDGYAIYYKRLEKGKFIINSNGKCTLTRREFLMLFEGVKPKYLDNRFKFEKESKI